MMDNTRAKLPPVLDATCGGRMMWFNKRHPLALYLDNREIADVELCDGRHFSVRPDIVADFTALPFPDGSFRLVVFDRLADNAASWIPGVHESAAAGRDADLQVV